MNRFKSKVPSTRKQFVIEELPAIDLDSIYIDGKRYYKTPDGKFYPSVTTVLSAMKDKTHLEKWRKRVGDAEADRVSKRASSRGTEMHQICEDYLRNVDNFIGNNMPLSIELFRNIRPIIDKNVEVVYGNEMALFSHTLKTAGRTDLFCRFMGVNTIADFKTSIKNKREDWIEDYFIQSTVYAIMIEEMYKDIKPIHIPQIAILIAIEEGEDKYQLFIKKTADYRDKAKKLFADYHEQNTLPSPADIEKSVQ